MMAAGIVRTFHITLIAVVASLLIGISSASAAGSPAWQPIAGANPTNLPPGGSGSIMVYAQNVGGATSSGTITIEDKLPTGLATKETPSSNGWNCLPAGSGQTTVTCTVSKEVETGFTPAPLVIPVNVLASTPEVLTNEVTASSPGALSRSYQQSVTVSPSPAKPGFQAAMAAAYDEDGKLTTQAGSHPYTGAAAVLMNTVLAPSGRVVPAGDLKTALAELPPGFLGNPVATPPCLEGTKDASCSTDTQVGTVQLSLRFPGTVTAGDTVHNVAAPIGYPAKFTFEAESFFQVNIVGGVRSDEDYGLNVESPNTAQLFPVFGFFVNLWGAPGSPDHTSQRCKSINGHNGCVPSSASAGNVAFLTQSSDCAFQAEQPPFVGTAIDTWLTPGAFEKSKFYVSPVLECGLLILLASLSFRPDKETAATPSAFDVNLTLPQDGLTDPTKLATPPLKESVVALPSGVVVNPSSADGLATCSTAQIGLRHPEPPATEFPAPNHIRFSKKSPECPDASKVGTVEVDTPLLENPLPGTLYLAAQDDNPFHSTLAVYLVIDDPTTGIVIKLPGKVVPDPVSGQMKAVFKDLPQLPFNELKLSFKGGERAPLATPDTCGKFATEGEFTPWSAPESGPPTLTTDTMEVTGGTNGAPCATTKTGRPFKPTFTAGTSNTNAGSYAPFSFKLTRNDGEQELKGLEFTMPRGLTGKLAGIPACSDGAIATAEHVTGKAEQASSSCPSGSQIGTVTSGAGIGGNPIYVNGKLYLAGPYKGAPLSAVAIVPAVAGPYDLGNVVSRTALYVDPVTAQLTAKTDPIPDILDGIPLALRSIKVNVNRANFILNPTSCEKMSIAAKVIGAGGNTVSTADDVGVSFTKPFQAGGCDSLAFKPKLSAKLNGGTHRNDHPSLRAVVSYPPGAGYANTGYVQVALPHSEFLDQGHINTVCTRPQFAAKACPAGSIYGHATATTPLLDQSLSGPVYLRSSDNKLPDLVVALRGPDSQPIEVALDGRIDSIHGGIRNTFEVVPDAPVSKFVLTMKGGNKGLLVNSRNLCKGKTPHMTVRLIGQNNKRADQFPPLQNDCKKKARHKKHRLRR
jgi:hypothetical protein